MQCKGLQHGLQRWIARWDSPYRPIEDGPVAVRPGRRRLRTAPRQIELGDAGQTSIQHPVTVRLFAGAHRNVLTFAEDQLSYEFSPRSVGESFDVVRMPVSKDALHRGTVPR